MSNDDIEYLAGGIFLAFYSSPDIFKIVRCNRCRIYAWIEHLRSEYVRGWHCVKCRKMAPAVEKTREIREAHRDKWFALAVKARKSWRPSFRNKDRVIWITEKVNERLRSGEQIKRNTISRHLATIEAAALTPDETVQLPQKEQRPRPENGEIKALIKLWG